MRTITGWTEEEIEELEWQKNQKNDFDDVLDVLYDQENQTYLKDKYMKSQIPEQMIFDMVDYWRGDGVFFNPRYLWKLKPTLTQETGKDIYLFKDGIDGVPVLGTNCNDVSIPKENKFLTLKQVRNLLKDTYFCLDMFEGKEVG
ncbi:hypothetical protein FC72_GL000516 [Companilactobacillus tucceti DSM 20183]|uniref:Uncharacterized protein n=1 Tax=Companilactobacillus tucceti DSM 20183 TaxID=1423811 RepID=A0A0R1J8M7_9LACO|nr:hypothetical protein [Companilactobacillus tucceti]KRK64346.1 hypothetical protein FC72_GL000516 [Companilactobacillus tucceti DSM 20183]